MGRPRFTSAVARGLMTLADQAQEEEGRSRPRRRTNDQRDRDRALEWLVATAEHRGLEWQPTPIAQPDPAVRSRDVPPEAPARERTGNALPEVGQVWADEDGIRFLIREVGLARRFGRGVEAWAILRMPGGVPKRVTARQWVTMRRRCTLVSEPSDDA